MTEKEITNDELMKKLKDIEGEVGDIKNKLDDSSHQGWYFFGFGLMITGGMLTITTGEIFGAILYLVGMGIWVASLILQRKKFQKKLW